MAPQVKVDVLKREDFRLMEGFKSKVSSVSRYIAQMVTDNEATVSWLQLFVLAVVLLMAISQAQTTLFNTHTSVQGAAVGSNTLAWQLKALVD